MLGVKWPQINFLQSSSKNLWALTLTPKICVFATFGTWVNFTCNSTCVTPQFNDVTWLGEFTITQWSYSWLTLAFLGQSLHFFSTRNADLKDVNVALGFVIFRSLSQKSPIMWQIGKYWTTVLYSHWPKFKFYVTILCHPAWHQQTDLLSITEEGLCDWIFRLSCWWLQGSDICMSLCFLLFFYVSIALMTARLKCF